MKRRVWNLLLSLTFCLCGAIAAPQGGEATAIILRHELPPVAASATQNPAEEEANALESCGEFTVTAYCSCAKCCGIWSEEHPSRKGTDYVQRTRSGTIPEAGRTVAADWSVLPNGTEIVIEGHTYIVEDTGSGVTGNHIDLFFDNHEDALNWGVKYMEVFKNGNA